MAVERLKSGQIGFKVYGPSDSEDEPVSASTFADKLKRIVLGLKAADEAVNGTVVHDYTIYKLHTSIPTAILNEVALTPAIHQGSGIKAFFQCADAVKRGSPDALIYGDTVRHIKTLSVGGKKQFGHAEMWISDSERLRADTFLGERAEEILSPKMKVLVAPDQKWFKGVVIGHFDGILKVVDTRGDLPRIKIQLLAGGKEIDGICRKEDLEALGDTPWDKRVNIVGDAIYDGKSGLPKRVEVRTIKFAPEGKDFSRWKGAFEPFTPPDWEGDDI